MLGNGENEHSDSDLLIDSEGRPFIPGSSLAGVIKGGLTGTTKISKQDMDLLLGEDGQNGHQSMVTIHDCFLKEDSKADIIIRDGIEINEYTKTAKNKSKYDFEVLNLGAVFQFRMEILIREQFYQLPVLQFVSDFFAFAESGDFRIGAKTNRGYGQVVMEQVCCRNLDFADAKKWKNPLDAFRAYVAFQWGDMKVGMQDAVLPPTTYHTPYTTIEVPLEVESTLLIRTYFLSTFDVDCEQLMVNGKAVIPGSAWAGCFRHKVKEFLLELTDKNRAREITNEMFGAEKDQNDAICSRIIFQETQDLREGNTLTKNNTRNKIDRFTGGVLKTALFSERIAVGGTYTLCMKLRDAKAYEIGLLLLAIQEVRYGLLAVGGTTSVGRGEFHGNGAIMVNSKTLREEDMKVYWDALGATLSK